jgi:hypothetical protein
MTIKASAHQQQEGRCMQSRAEECEKEIYICSLRCTSKHTYIHTHTHTHTNYSLTHAHIHIHTLTYYLHTCVRTDIWLPIVPPTLRGKRLPSRSKPGPAHLAKLLLAMQESQAPSVVHLVGANVNCYCCGCVGKASSCVRSKSRWPKAHTAFLR